MQYYIDDARIHCPCIDSSDLRSLHPVSKMHFCPTCRIRRCFFCSLHSPSKKFCTRCDRAYSLQDTHCYRCYTCPECDHDLESSPLLYKHKEGESETRFEQIKSKHDKSKIAGKAVQFKCPNLECRYKYTTSIETKPQSLQQIVQNNIKDDHDNRYSELMEYFDWCLNYQRILDKRQRSKWKTEILKKFKSFEVAKILQDESNLQQVADKESQTIRHTVDKKSHRQYPRPKLLHTEMQDTCPSCLEDLCNKKMASILPKIYALPMVGYPSSKIRNLEAGESLDVPILISIVNDSESKLTLNIIEDEITTFLPRSSPNLRVIPYMDDSTKSNNEKFSTVPTCLLSNVSKKEGNWKAELEGRDSDSLVRLRYVESSNLDENEGLLDTGVNWITLLLIVRVVGDEASRSGRIKFVLDLGVERQDADALNAEYYCCALV